MFPRETQLGSNIILSYSGPELRSLSDQVWVSRLTAKAGSLSPAHVLPTALLTQAESLFLAVEAHGATWNPMTS